MLYILSTDHELNCEPKCILFFHLNVLNILFFKKMFLKSPWIDGNVSEMCAVMKRMVIALC